jgi:hypothetical protein
LNEFKLTYSGKPSLFEGKVSPPKDVGEVELLVLAADRAGNFGIHALSYILPP